MCSAHHYTPSSQKTFWDTSWVLKKYLLSEYRNLQLPEISTNIEDTPASPCSLIFLSLPPPTNPSLYGSTFLASGAALTSQSLQPGPIQMLQLCLSPIQQYCFSAGLGVLGAGFVTRSQPFIEIVSCLYEILQCNLAPQSPEALFWTHSTD